MGPASEQYDLMNDSLSDPDIGTRCERGILPWVMAHVFVISRAKDVAAGVSSLNL